jgi:PAS domain S-box-containing protein
MNAIAKQHGSFFSDLKNAPFHVNQKELLKAIPALVWLADKTGRRHFFNKVWTDFTGHTEEAERQGKWLKSIHSADLSNFLHITEKALQEQKPFEVTYRFRRHDNTYRWVMDRGSPYQDENHAFAGFAGVCLDIHEQKLADIKMKQREHERLCESAF